MIDQNLKQYLGIVAIFLTFIGFAPYIYSILSNKTKPHFFTWIIWGMSTTIIFIAQFYSGGGYGSWSIGVSGLFTISVAIMGYYKKSEGDIVRSDWISLFIVLLAIPCWYLTSNPLYSVIILTSIDIVGYFPTLRKAYHKPDEESITIFVIMSVRNLISIVALETYSVTNILFQTAMTIANLLVILVVLNSKFLTKLTKNSKTL